MYTVRLIRQLATSEVAEGTCRGGKRMDEVKWNEEVPAWGLDTIDESGTERKDQLASKY